MRRLAAFSLPQRLALLLAACVVAAAVLLAVSEDGSRSVAGVEIVTEDPFEPGRHADDELLARGADGLAHALYALSPGGVEASAERTARWRDQIRAAAQSEGVSPETLEALVLLESAGRPEVTAGPSPESAAGLAQILPGTATDLLGMAVDLQRSKRLSRAIARAQERAIKAHRRAARREARRRERTLRGRRREVDERFDPPEALRGAARYLAYALDRFGREDLAAASYHMGIGNLEQVIATYLSPEPVEGTTRATVAEHDLSYAEIYFGSTPTRNPRTYELLRGFGDDSRHYLFRLEAAREIMRLLRTDRDELRRLAVLHGNKASAEEVLRPPARTERFEAPEDLRDGYEDGDLVRLRERPGRLGFRIDPRMGELAPALGAERALYRGLRPEALAVVLYLAREAREIAGHDTVLTLTSTVRDSAYQKRLAQSNPQATDGYSLHTTGYAFDVARDLGEDGERALEAVLVRLRALNVVDWVYEPGALHVTVGPDAERLLD